MKMITVIFLAFAGIGVVAWIAWELAALIAWLKLKFREKRPSVGPFGSIEAVSQGKEHDMDVIEYKISLPVSPSTDVAKKILTIRRADIGVGSERLEAVEIRHLPNEQTEARVKAVQDSRVDLELVAVDDSGNRSDPIYAYFTALDTIRPVLPGEMVVTAVGEDAAEAPTDTPPAETSDDTDGAAVDPEAPPAHVPPAASNN